MSDGRSLGIGMLGYGGIGRVHAMSYRQLPFVYPGSISPRLRTVCTSRDESAAAAMAEAGFENATSRLDEVFSDAGVDLVDITLPNHLHRDAVTAALAAGKAIYCEKPLAGTVEDARAIAEAVRRSALPFGMVFQYRFVPALMKARPPGLPESA